MVFHSAVTHHTTMILLLLLLTATVPVLSQRIQGEEVNGTCECKVNSTLWMFPAVKYETVSQLLQSCDGSLHSLQTQTVTTRKELPKLKETLENVMARMQRFQYLKNSGVYNSLHLRQLGQELQQLQQMVSSAHLDKPGAETQKLGTELLKLQKEVEKMYKDNIFNLESVRERLRFLSNRAQTCRSMPDDFRSSCSQRVMKNISSPETTKLNPFSKSYTSGSWGRDTSQRFLDTYWVQPLVSGHRHGSTVRLYQGHADFMAGRNYKDESVAPSYNHADAIQGPGTVLHDKVLYFQCHNTAVLCSFNLETNEKRRLPLPDAGVNNRFPYCYYTCHDWTDIDIAADHQGIWAIYATEGNHGNIVLSRVDTENFNVTHTWKTRLFKRSVTNTFMVCGVLYATRFVNTYREEVFYAFDTITGTEDNTLALPLEKVSANVANLHYNPNDMKLYMYNDGYLLAYQAFF